MLNLRHEKILKHQKIRGKGNLKNKNKNKRKRRKKKFNTYNLQTDKRCDDSHP